MMRKRRSHKGRVVRGEHIFQGLEALLMVSILAVAVALGTELGARLSLVGGIDAYAVLELTRLIAPRNLF